MTITINEHAHGDDHHHPEVVVERVDENWHSMSRTERLLVDIEARLRRIETLIRRNG